MFAYHRSEYTIKNGIEEIYSSVFLRKLIVMEVASGSETFMSNDNQRKRIAFLTSLDSLDKRSWSGIFYQMARSLQKHCGEVVYVGPATIAGGGLKGSMVGWMKGFLKKVARRYFVYDYHIRVARNLACAANQRLLRELFDVIVAPASLAQVAFLETDVPVIIVEDATFALLLDYYPQYSNMLSHSIEQVQEVAVKGMKKASALVYSSAWAAQSAINEYHIDARKVHVVPMGANFDNPPDEGIIERKKRSGVCKLLFVGVDWQRKGGDIAFETLLVLTQIGIPAELTICGCTPPKNRSHPDMKIVPYLDKNDPRQYEQLVQLYLEADFLLLPTRNECFGIVFCEANAFGLPAITTCTGGVSEVVRNGENGFVLPLEARGDAYALLIASLYRDAAQYARLVLSSRAAYDERLNWDSWGVAMNTIITDVLQHRIAPHKVSRQVAG
jgi:glycosyltransferase involved in cell wall biosynthesis